MLLKTIHFPFFIIFCLIFGLTFKGVSQHIKLQHYGVEQGLSNSASTCFFQDHHGFLWIGTSDGLNRFDGYNFKVFKHSDKDSNSVVGNVIKCIIEDSNRDLWIGTTSGLSQYIPESESFVNFKHQNGNPSSLADNTVINMKLTTDKKLYFFVNEVPNLQDFDFKRKIFNPVHFNIEGTDSSTFYEFIQESEYALWVGYFKHIARFDKREKSWKVFEKSNYGDKIARINDSYISKNGDLWLATHYGLLHYSESKKQLKSYYEEYKDSDQDQNIKLSSNHICSITEDFNGTIIAGTMNGLTFISPNSGIYKQFKYDPLQPEGLSSEKVSSVFTDKTGIVWIGSTKGISKLSYSFQNFKTLLINQKTTEYLKSNDINAVSYWSENEIVIGIKGRILTYNFINESLRSISTILDNNISNQTYSVQWLLRKDDFLYLLFEKTLFVFHIKKQKFIKKIELLDSSDREIKTDLVISENLQENKVLFLFYRKNAFKTIEFDLNTLKLDHSISYSKELSVNNAKQDNFHNYWMSSSILGLYYLRPSTKKIDNYMPFPSYNGKIAYMITYDLKMDPPNHLWVTSKNEGLIHLNIPKRKWYRINEESKLASSFVLSVQIDRQKRAWITTAKGISCVDTLHHIKNYSMAHGLIDNQYRPGSSYQHALGWFFFPGKNGLLYFHPDSIHMDNFPPDMVLTDFRVNNQSWLSKHNSHFKILGDTIDVVLQSNENAFSAEFSALHFASPLLHQYAYMLIGYDKNWIYEDARHRTANYANLPSGDYTLLIKGSQMDQVWSKRYLVLHIHIQKAFYQTWWFILVLLSAFGIFVYLFYKNRINQVKSENLETLVKERTIELEEKNEQIQAFYDALEIQQAEINNVYTSLKDNIEVAKLIQMSILPPIEQIKSNFEQSFVLYLPKDVVCGDFYWMERKNGLIFIAAVDCTGHGVSGAMMSMLGYNLLNEAVRFLDKPDPARILDYINHGLVKSLRQEEHEVFSRDGMDISLCAFREDFSELYFAGAITGLCWIRNQELHEIKGDRRSIGMKIKGEFLPYTLHTISLNKGDQIYITSDGYISQFGGPEGHEKFKPHRLRTLIHQSLSLPQTALHDFYEQAFRQWQGNTEQTDDVILIGIRV